MRITQHWRLNDDRYELKGNAADNETKTFPPRNVESREVTTYDLDDAMPEAGWVKQEVNDYAGAAR